LVIDHHTHRALAHFRRKLVRRLAHTGSTFSGVGASGKPGAVHSEAFFEELLSADDQASEAQIAKKIQKLDNGIEAQMRVLEIRADDWSKVFKALALKKVLSTKEAGILQIAMQMPSKIPTEKQSIILIEVLDKARLEGVALS
ncbi:hypothetical protein, partial [Sphingomonas sp. ERG5]|uniref:hypothetical protein n=1 Tax=Sphingomonas sp. ERG5 TaxID=1381597 RepID=UPI00054C5535